MNRFFNATVGSEIKCDRVEEFIAECINIDIALFYIDDRDGKQYLKSFEVDAHIRKMKERSEAARKSIDARWQKAREQGQSTEEPSGQRRLPLGPEPAGKAKPPKEKHHYTADEIEYKIALLIWDKLAKPSGAKQPNMQRWADDVRLIVEADKRKPQYVLDCIKAVLAHEGNNFRWRNVVKCPDTLRKQMNAGRIYPDMNKGNDEGGKDGDASTVRKRHGR